ncbi:MAG: peptidoglycan-associated lipoprotein Pal [Oligoflexia bacterium]|nr:peptidoglycan-associated lipoprotein Pal [Oligoflexia bacterium]MBF0363923.1 peptidoglycan-associated lipoprotein Pal [Oligoflexia bacterium]
MKSFLKSISTVAVFVLALSFYGCASQDKKGESLTGSDAAAKDATAFDLYGDSDNSKAGALKTVYFDFNSSTLTGSTEETLKGNASFLKENNKVKVQVEGHCDERGSIQYNLALGERRAKSVKDYLVASGVNADRITTISYGKEKPIAMGQDEDSWSKNRRGNFVVTEK